MAKSKYEPKQGTYILSFPSKYTGEIKDGGVFYRSSWEKRVFTYMDNNKNVIEWSSESLVVPYLFSLDNKVHRYYPDILCKIDTKDGLKSYMIEVKPESQTKEPLKPQNRSLARKQRFEKEMFTYVKNQDKWKAAKEYSSKNGLEFILITEKELFGV